jgi:hypothetical protein
MYVSTSVPTSSCINTSTLRRTGSTSIVSCAATTRLPAASDLQQLCCALRLLVGQLQRLYLNHAVRPGVSAPHAARRRLLCLRCTIGCLGSSCGSSSTTSPTPRDRVPRLLARLVVGSSRDSSLTTSPTPCDRVPRLLARLVVDYFIYAMRLGSSAHHAARRRLLRLCRATGCLGLSSTTSPTSCNRVPRPLARLIIDYFAHVVRLGASAPRAARHRLLCPCRATWCLVSSRSSLSTTSPMSCDWVPRLLARLVVDCFAYAVHPGTPSVGRTGSRHALGHSVSQLDYSTPGCTCSTAPMSCIRTFRLVARLLFG